MVIVYEQARRFVDAHCGRTRFWVLSKFPISLVSEVIAVGSGAWKLIVQHLSNRGRTIRCIARRRATYDQFSLCDFNQTLRCVQCCKKNNLRREERCGFFQLIIRRSTIASLCASQESYIRQCDRCCKVKKIERSTKYSTLLVLGYTITFNIVFQY